MGTSQSKTNTYNFNLHQLFPNAIKYKPIKNNKNKFSGLEVLYMNQQNSKIAEIRTYQIYGNKKNTIQSYYTARLKLHNPYIFSLIDNKIIPNASNKQIYNKLNLSTSNFCTAKTFQNKLQAQFQHNTLLLFVQSSGLCLEDQIQNRINKKSFDQAQLWSVLSSCVLGAISLSKSGFKQPVLSPKGIGLFEDGTIKVGQWEFVSKLNENSLSQQGEILFGKHGTSISSQESKNSLNKILLQYYWAPQGLKAMENFINLGKKQQQKNSIRQYQNSTSKATKQKFQIFSLGMTLISMCLRNFYYRAENFSQKYLNKLTHQAVQIRKVQGKQLSSKLIFIIESMVKWDPSQRITYIELYNLILEHFNQHPEQINNSSISLISYNQIENSRYQNSISQNSKKSRSQSQSSNLSMNLPSIQQTFTSANSFALADTQMNFQNNKSNQLYNFNCNSMNSMSEKNEGSGTVVQGNGDNDQNLQFQKQQIFSDKEDQQLQELKRSWTSHRTQKQKIQRNSDLQISPSQNRRHIECPAPTPNLSSPLIWKYIQVKHQNQSKINELGITRNPYIQNQSWIKFEPKSINKINKNNQVYLQQYPIKKPQLNLNQFKQQKNYDFSLTTNLHNQIYKRSDCNLINSTNASYRGSYRSINKQPPNIYSARMSFNKSNQIVNYPQYGRQSFTNSRLTDKTTNFYKNQIIFQYRNGPPIITQPLEIDTEDQINKFLDYQHFKGQVQQQNRDMFYDQQPLEQSQVQQKSNNSDMPLNNYTQVYFNSSNKNNISPKSSCVTNENQIYESSKRTSQQNYYNPREVHYQPKEDQFMTFNKKPTQMEYNFDKILLQKSTTSKWNKLPIKKLRQIQPEENLFTDPKLWQYIKNPIKIERQSSMQSTSRFNQSDYPNTLQQQADLNSTLSLKARLQNKRSYNQKKAFCQESKQNLKSKANQEKKYQNKIEQILSNGKFDSSFSEGNTFNQRKIVKQKVIKGIYEGQKKNGLRCGYGIFYYNQGGKYKGNWQNNQMHGKGTLEYADGRIAYQGDWNCDNLHGKGILYNQSPNFASTNLNYENLDKLDQYWIYYQGTFQNDDKSGMGLLMLSNHQQFIGQFKNDMADGVGQYLKMDGTIVKGIWQKNKLVKIINQQ